MGRGRDLVSFTSIWCLYLCGHSGQEGRTPPRYVWNTGKFFTERKRVRPRELDMDIKSIVDNYECFYKLKLNSILPNFAIS